MIARRTGTRASAAAGRKTVRILGIDPGSLHTGYAVIEADLASAARGRGPRLGYLECGVIAAPARLEVGDRMLAIANDLVAVIEEFAPEQAAIERAFFGVNIRSALTLGQARGALMLVVAQRGLTCTEYAPALVKRVVAGHGAARKRDVAQRVALLCELAREPAPDAADALAIACCHALSVL